MPETAKPPLMLWRAFVPRWAHEPLSGEGAARFGGRWNPVGAPTIYAARELSTAWSEYNQGFVQHPALIAQLSLTDALLADITEGSGLSSRELREIVRDTQWRADMDQGKRPSTHILREVFLDDGYDGVIYPSIMSPGGSCVALWRWNAAGAPRLDVVDPEGRLPKGPASWM